MATDPAPDRDDLAARVRRARDEVRRAFDRERPPGPGRLLDDARWPGDERHLRDFRRGGWVRWWDVPTDVVERNPEALALFSPEALRFYLPAYLTFVLDRPGSGSLAVGMTISTLDPGQKPAARQRFLDRFGGFDATRRDAVASFLRLVRDALGEGSDAEGARIALERWWDREDIMHEESSIVDQSASSPAAEIFHIAARAAWESAQAGGGYRGGSLAIEGFIHCCTAAQVAGVAARYYRGRAGLVLLRVDPGRLRAPVRWEAAPGSGEAFPHAYGPLDLDAVTGVTPFDPGPA